MAVREEDVVKSLVEKVCESHSVGCSLVDILTDIDHLCQADRYPVAKTSNDSVDVFPISWGTRSSPERIWKLFRDHPQISIGLDRQYNALTLADLWDHNAAALARIYFVAHTGHQNQKWNVAGPGAEKPWSSTSQCLPDTAVKQAGHAGRGQLPLSSTTPTESATKQPGSMKVKEAVSSLPKMPALTISDKQSTAAATQSSSVERGREAEHFPSGHTTEANKDSNRPSHGADSESTRSASPISTIPGDTDPSMPMRHTSALNIVPSLHAQGLTQELINLPRHKGRSRKYLRGTESFWNEMFWHARNQCEGRVTSRSRGGIASHPGARALYAKRPAGIDEVILGAIEADLPLPIDPQDITCAWRDRTAWVLNRSQEGVYISPQGVQRVDVSQYANHSDAPLCQILILRSNRLQEVAYSEPGQRANSQPPLSSATNPNRPQGFTSLRPTSSTGPFGPQPPTFRREKNLSFIVPALTSVLPRGPPLGVFEIPENDSLDMLVPPIIPSELAAAPVRRTRIRGDSVTAGNTSPLDSRSRATTVSLESPDLSAEQYAYPVVESWRGLPPPLTTRSRKRKLSEDLPTAKESPKRRKVDGTAGGVAESESSLERPIEATIHKPIDMVDVDIDTPTTLLSRASTSERAQLQKLKVPRKKAVRGELKEILKQILIEIIDECGGMIPNDYLCISEYVSAKYHARSKSGQPDKKLCKDIIKSFCTNGRFKRLAFTFQRQSGTMATRTILANLDVDATSEAVARLQQNIINALPGLYVPPLGSILDAPLIEALPPDIPPTPVPTQKRPSASGALKHKIAVRRLRTRKGARKDVLGTLPSRRPFAWHGSPHLVPIPGSEDDLALAFAYVAANWSNTGYAVWKNASGGLTGEDVVRAERMTALPKAFVSTRRPIGSSRGSNDPAYPRERPDKLNWRTQKRVTSLTFDPEAHDLTLNGATMSAGAPKFGRSSRGRKITWKTRESEVLPPPFPSSLHDILDMPGQIPKIDYSMTQDPVTNFFFWELDAVEYWEGNILKIYQQRAPDWTFISHIASQSNVADLPAYPHLQWTDPNILTTATFTPQPTYITRGKPTRKQKPAETIAEEIDHESVDSDYDPTTEGMPPGPTQRTRRRSSLRPVRRPKESARKRRPTKPQVKHSEAEELPPERQIRSRILHSMAGEEIYRIVIAVIVVRTLAGGITGEIDWSIVHKLCPNRDPAFLADRWSTLLVKNRRDIASLTESMQKKYIVAYEDGEVPCIDFDDLEHTDWEAIRSWAEWNLDKNLSDDIEALPNARSELLRTTKFTFTEQQTLRDTFMSTSKQPQVMREEILARTPAAVRLHVLTDTTIGLRVESEVEEEDFNLSLARSWAFATITTPKESLNHSAVTEKLMSITSDKTEADRLFDRAIKILQRNQIITRNKSFEPGQWRVTERWFETFESRRMITVSMLKKAVAWKRDVLDPAVLKGQSVLIDKMQIMHDGEMVAIVNMVANGRCKITAGPAGLPRGRYGLDPNAKSYNTKGMSRLLTLFATTICPTQSYVVGDPMAADRLEIPCWQDGGRGKIPCWIDMNGKVLMRIWEMAISAIVGLLSGRPGITAVEIVRTLGHAVTKWEIETMLAWLEGSGFARRTEHGIGWETKEWWWMVCGIDVHDAPS